MIFYLSMMEYFCWLCEEQFMRIEQAQKCLDIYKSIQDALGFTFCNYFLNFQILIVISLYMCISTVFFGSYDCLSNIIISLCYAIMFLFCSITLYFLINASENAHISLKKLANPMTVILMRETDKEEMIKIQLLLKEIENIPPLNGNGYFELKRETLTSITSTTVTYLIILLQFRSSGSEEKN